MIYRHWEWQMEVKFYYIMMQIKKVENPNKGVKRLNIYIKKNNNTQSYYD